MMILVETNNVADTVVSNGSVKTEITQGMHTHCEGTILRACHPTSAPC